MLAVNKSNNNTNKANKCNNNALGEQKGDALQSWGPTRILESSLYLRGRWLFMAGSSSRKGALSSCVDPQQPVIHL